jgi:hypothetical protein
VTVCASVAESRIVGVIVLFFLDSALPLSGRRGRFLDFPLLGHTQLVCVGTFLGQFFANRNMERGKYIKKWKISLIEMTEGNVGTQLDEFSIGKSVL